MVSQAPKPRQAAPAMNTTVPCRALKSVSVVTHVFWKYSRVWFLVTLLKSCGNSMSNTKLCYMGKASISHSLDEQAHHIIRSH